MNADRLPDEMPLRALCPRMVCTACGLIGADVRPDWSAHTNKRSTLRIALVQSQRRDECRPAAGRNAAARSMPAHGLHGLRPDRRRCAPGLVSAYQQAVHTANRSGAITAP